jgi:pyruvate ferredoxin oxidoreductase delta subunit
MCPDGAIVVKDGKVVEINYDFCKGCGICANQCNFNALEMKNEDEFE